MPTSPCLCFHRCHDRLQHVSCAYLHGIADKLYIFVGSSCLQIKQKGFSPLCVLSRSPERNLLKQYKRSINLRRYSLQCILPATYVSMSGDGNLGRFLQTLKTHLLIHSWTEERPTSVLLVTLIKCLCSKLYLFTDSGRYSSFFQVPDTSAAVAKSPAYYNMVAALQGPAAAIVRAADILNAPAQAPTAVSSIVSE